MFHFILYATLPATHQRNDLVNLFQNAVNRRFHCCSLFKCILKIFLLLFYFFLALTVRYLTRRFIGEYRSKTDLLYKQTVVLDTGLLDVEIVDISAESDDEFPLEQILWADACLIVYSITDRSSFEYVARSLAEIRQLQSQPVAYLIANKADLDHLRQVS